MTSLLVHVHDILIKADDDQGIHKLLLNQSFQMKDLGPLTCNFFMKFSPAQSLTEQSSTILLYHYWNPTEDSHNFKTEGAGPKLLVSLSRSNEQWLHIGLGSILVLAAMKMYFPISWKEESVNSTTLRWAAEAKPCIFSMKWHNFRLCKATHLLKLLMCLFCLQPLSFWRV